LQHLSALISENNKICQTEQAVVPFMISVHWSSVHTRTNFCLCLPNIST